MAVAYNPNRTWLGSNKAQSPKKSSKKSVRRGFQLQIKWPWQQKFHGDKLGRKSPLLSKLDRSKKEPPTTPVSQFKSQSTPEYKIFKPSNQDLIKEKIKSSVPLGRGNKKSFSFGFKTLETLGDKARQFTIKDAWMDFKLTLTRFSLLQRFNRLMSLGILISIAGFFVYLCFFDRFFLVKNYTVTFDDKSFISKQDMSKVLEKVRQDKFLGFIPNNQLWFMSSQNLTLTAQKIYPEIQSVQVEHRYWPNTAELKVTTEPVLITLGINNREYWRISQDGKVLSLDEAGLRENLVVVEKAVSFNRPGVTLQNYSFQDNPNLQLNRFWFIVWLWDQLKQQGIQVVKTTLPSLFDYDVNIETSTGVKLIFNSTSMSQDAQQKRIQTILTSTVKDRITKGDLTYIDFRIPRKVFLCSKLAECAKN